MMLSSNSVYNHAIDELRGEVAFDYFVTLPTTVNDIELVNLETSLQSSYIAGVERYVVIRGVINDVHYALCALESDSKLWDYVLFDGNLPFLYQNESFLVVNPQKGPAYSKNDNFSIIQTFTTNQSIYGYTRFNMKIKDYVETTLESTSLTGQMSQALGIFRETPPDTILFCSYEETIIPYLEFLAMHGEPNYHSFFFGLVITTDSSIVFDRYLDGTLEAHLNEIRIHIDSAIEEFDVLVVYDNLAGSFVLLDELITTLNTNMLLDLIPLLAIMGIVCIIQLKESNAENDEDFEKLRQKGVGLKDILKVLAIESIIMSTISTTIGFCMASALVYIGNVMNQQVFYPIRGNDLLYYLGFSYVLSVISYLLLARMTLNSLNNAYPENKLGNSKRLHVLCFITGSLKLLEWIFGISVLGFRLENHASLPSIIMVILSFLQLFDTVLDYIAIILFIIGLVGLVFSSSLVHVFFQKLSSLVPNVSSWIGSSYISRNQRCLSRISLCILLVTSFGVYASSNSDSYTSLRYRQAYAANGGEINAILDNQVNLTEFVEVLHSLDNIESFTFEFDYELAMNGMRIPIKAVNFTEWLDVVYWEANWFTSDHNDLESLLTSNNTIILENKISKENELAIGTTVELKPITILENDSVDAIITGLFGPTPNIRTYSGGVNEFLAEETYSIIPLELARNVLGITPRMTSVVVRVVNDTAISDIVTEISEWSIYQPQTVSSRIDVVTTEEYQLSLFQMINLIFMLFLSTLGVSVIVSGTITRRHGEYNYIRSRGISQSAVKKSLYFEFIPLAIISSLGLLTGLLQTYGKATILEKINAAQLVTFQLTLGANGMFLCFLVLALTILAIVFTINHERFDVKIIPQD